MLSSFNEINTIYSGKDKTKIFAVAEFIVAEYLYSFAMVLEEQLAKFNLSGVPSELEIKRMRLEVATEKLELLCSEK